MGNSRFKAPLHVSYKFWDILYEELHLIFQLLKVWFSFSIDFDCLAQLVEGGEQVILQCI